LSTWIKLALYDIINTMIKSINNLQARISEAIAHYWRTREGQAKKQEISGKADQGSRGAVTGGSQMDGFIKLLNQLVIEAGINAKNIFFKSALELPGFFRPTKEWDFLVIKDDQLIIAIEAKSQVGPSFGNNFNNRTEEAIGSAVDLWTAYREGAFNRTVKPWLGYIFLLEDCESSQKSVKVKEPHFKVFPEFVNASYAKRYEYLCRKLVRERHYNIASFLLSGRESGLDGEFYEPTDDLTFELFARSLVAQASIYGDQDNK